MGDAKGLVNAISALEQCRSDYNILVKRLKNAHSLSKNTISMTAQVKKELNGFFNEFTLEDAIGACKYTGEVSFDKCKNAIAAEKMYFKHKEREEVYGRLLSSIANAILWYADRKEAEHEAAEYLHDVVYKHMKQTGKELFKKPWWVGHISCLEKRMMDLYAKKLEEKHQKRAELDKVLKEKGIDRDKFYRENGLEP